MEYSEVSAALVYFPIDKSFALYPTNDVIGWNPDAYEKLSKGECVSLEAKYDYVQYSVR